MYEGMGPDGGKVHDSPVKQALEQSTALAETRRPILRQRCSRTRSSASALGIDLGGEAQDDGNSTGTSMKLC